MNLEGCSSIEELQRRAREHLENAGNHGHFLEGLGWDQDLLGTTPSRLDVSGRNIQLIEFKSSTVAPKNGLLSGVLSPFQKGPTLRPNGLRWGGDFVLSVVLGLAYSPAGHLKACRC